MTDFLSTGTLPDEYEQLAKTVRDFARNVVAPVAAKHDTVDETATRRASHIAREYVPCASRESLGILELAQFFAGGDQYI